MSIENVLLGLMVRCPICGKLLRKRKDGKPRKHKDCRYTPSEDTK